MRYGQTEPRRGRGAGAPCSGDGTGEAPSVDALPRPGRFPSGTEVGAEAWAATDETTQVGSRPGHGRTRVACVSGVGDVTELTHHALAHAGAPDAVEFLRSPQPRSRAARTQLWQIMSHEVVCVRRDLDATLILPLLTALDVRVLTVVDDAGRPLGMVSRSDALQHGPAIAGATVEDVMMSMAFMLEETASLSQAAALMSYEEVHRLPVVSSEGRVVGVVSALDVARWLAQHDGYVVPDPAAQPARFDFLVRIAAALAGTKGVAT
jgi:CBS-domain-containing membrane protein